MSLLHNREMAKKQKKTTRRWWLRLLGNPWIFLLFALILFVKINFIYQLVRKPAEFLNLVGFGQAKTLQQTWSDYADLFKENQTKLITADFLAALAQTESSGNPFASPQWQLKWTDRISQFYAPASTSVGLFQLTNGTFDQAKQFCISDGKVLKAGVFPQLDRCWFNFLYHRWLPSHATEMTAAYLHKTTSHLIERAGRQSLPLWQKQRVAAIVHLCGQKKAEAFLHRQMKVESMGFCGSHSVKRYIHQIERFKNKAQQWNSRL